MPPETEAADGLWLVALREKDAESRRFTPVPTPLLLAETPDPVDQRKSGAEILKAGAVWTVKAYLFVLFLIVVVLFVFGFLADPFGSLTGNGY